MQKLSVAVGHVPVLIEVKTNEYYIKDKRGKYDFIKQNQRNV